jgi:hypothetical protein
MATYVSLVNEVLRRMNEVQLDTGGNGFSDVRNLQALAKDAVNASVREILQTSQEWPFTLKTYTQTLTSGTGTYDFPADFSKVDWDTFYIKKLVSKDNEPKRLPVITYNDYIRDYRGMEDSSGTGGYSVPIIIYQTQDTKFGATPIPDAAYEIEYRYWYFPAELVVYNDTCIIPDRFNNVIVDGAVMYLMRFRANEQGGAIHQQKFENGIDSMRRILLDSPMYVTSTIVAGRYFNSNTGTK